ncbi:arginine permease [Purpureocillium lavendulum]|uniref:Arginine permease n=1 Tax=Purpureocillium lavendulum TaxID=1247861 RepID=A0AB34FNQ8_9HYPO|nr:arginine permease [Purpureocillium lavendulum]
MFNSWANHAPAYNPPTVGYVASPYTYPQQQQQQMLLSPPPLPPPAPARRTSGYLAQPARQTGYHFDQPLGTAPGSYGQTVVAAGVCPVGVCAGAGVGAGAGAPVMASAQVYQLTQSPAVYVSAPAPAPVSFVQPATGGPAVVYVVYPPTVVATTAPAMLPLPAPAAPPIMMPQLAMLPQSMPTTTPATTSTAMTTTNTESPTPTADAAIPTTPRATTSPRAPEPRLVVRIVFYGRTPPTTHRHTYSSSSGGRVWIRVVDASYASAQSAARLLRGDAARFAARIRLPGDQRGKRMTLYVLAQWETPSSSSPPDAPSSASWAASEAGVGGCSLRIVADGGVVVPAAGVEAVVPLGGGGVDNDGDDDACLEETLGKVLRIHQQQQQHQQDTHQQDGAVDRARRHVFLAVDVDDMWKGPEGGEARVPPAGGEGERGAAAAGPDREVGVSTMEQDPAPTPVTEANEHNGYGEQDAPPSQLANAQDDAPVQVNPEPRTEEPESQPEPHGEAHAERDEPRARPANDGEHAAHDPEDGAAAATVA